MTHVWADRVAETTTTTGTGALALGGAISGFQRFSAVCSTNDTVVYAIEAVDGSGVPTGDWEVGIGTYSGVNTLTRTTIIKSSNSNSVVTLAAGTKNVFLDDIASTRNTLQQYTGTNEPSAPVEGLIFWAQDRNGWPVPMYKGSSNRSMSISPINGGRATLAGLNAVASGAVMATFGNTGVGTTSALAIPAAATNQYTTISRVGANTTSTASTAADIRATSSTIFFRGAAANAGFRLTMAGGLETVGNTNCRWFFGLYNTLSAAPATFDPAATTNVLIGIGATATDTANAKLYYATGSVVNSIDLGANFPAKTAQGGMYELYLWCGGSSATSVNYYVRRLDDLTIAPVSGTISTNLPAAVAMYPHWTINNNATAAQSVLACGNAYWETGI